MDSTVLILSETGTGKELIALPDRALCKKAGKKIRNILKETLQLFQAYDWPGNIRELQNGIERAVVLCDSETFSVDEAWLMRTSRTGCADLSTGDHDRRARKGIIEAALASSQGRISGPAGAAAKLVIPRQTLESKSKLWELIRIASKLAKLTDAQRAV